LARPEVLGAEVQFTPVRMNVVGPVTVTVRAVVVLLTVVENEPFVTPLTQTLSLVE
jgi:hypothetical protein